MLQVSHTLALYLVMGVLAFFYTSGQSLALLMLSAVAVIIVIIITIITIIMTLL